jgi:hypothetical protein
MELQTIEAESDSIRLRGLLDTMAQAGAGLSHRGGRHLSTTA